MISRPPVVLFAVLLALLGVTGSAHAASPLLGQWPMDAKHVGGGLDQTDDTSGGNAPLGTPSGSMAIDPAGKFGGALSASNHTTLTTVDPGPTPPKVTLLAWIKQNGDPGRLKYVAGRGDDGPGICNGSSFAIYSGYTAMPGLRFY
ncbi:MAG: hypothetical protein AAGC46_10355, partial [Solirubrobacteraceae bacterium]